MKLDTHIHTDVAIKLLLAVYVFFLPFLPKISVLCIIGLAVLILFSGRVKSIFSNIKNNRFFLFLVGFYALHVVGLLYSDNLNYGLFDLQVKLSFLVFPLILPAVNWEKSLFSFIKKSFVVGCLASCLICIVYAIVAYQKNHEISDFFYARFSRFLHPTYITFYINLAIFFIIHDLFHERKFTGFLSMPLLLGVLFFFILNIILISSRTASLVAYITIFIYLSICLFQNGFSAGKIFLLIGAIIVVGSIHFMSLHFYDRYSELKTEFKEERQKMNSLPVTRENEIQENENSASVRVKLWHYALELIRDHPVFGVGTGDIKEELVTYYKRNNWNYGVETRHNPHNQYLHTTVILGVIGLSLLLLNLIVPLFKAFKRKNWIYFLFLLMIMLNALTESILEVQAGILFFTFFTCLFYLEIENDSRQI